MLHLICCDEFPEQHILRAGDVRHPVARVAKGTREIDSMATAYLIDSYDCMIVMTVMYAKMKEKPAPEDP